MSLPPGGIEQLVHQYGPAGLFVLLALGIVGLPVPDETLLTLSGYLISTGQESYLPVAIAAFCGSALGISLSFVIGRYPVNKLIIKYSHWIHITPERYQKADAWFQKRGKLLLSLGYYIPGFRHVAAIVAGTSGMPYHQFAMYAFSGALLWSNTFLLLGYFTGRDYAKITRILHQYLLWLVLAFVILSIIIYTLNKRNNHEE